MTTVARHRRRDAFSNPAAFARTYAVGVCQHCDKRTYLSRKAAKAVAKRVNPGDPGTAYPCPHNGQHWHVGHLPPAIKHGRQSR